MLKNVLARLKEDPLGFINRAIYKTVIGPLKYGRGNDYDAARYWHDRFSRYGQSFKSVGHEGLSEEENEKMYKEAADVFKAACARGGIDFASANALEIGCGTGFYTQLLYDMGVRRCTAVDITDAFFPELTKKFPKFSFLRKDITSDKIEGEFDLVVMIDIIEHIVDEAKLTSAMENVKECLSDNGIFVIAPIMDSSKRQFFHMRSFTLEDIKQRFAGYSFGELIPFRLGSLLLIRKKGS